MKHKIIFALAVIIMTAGCSKEQFGNSLTWSNESYKITSADAFSFGYDSDYDDTNIELILYLDGSTIIEQDKCIYLDLYFPGNVGHNFPAGTYSLSDEGDVVLDEVAIILNNGDFDCFSGTLEIGRKGKNYKFSFSGTCEGERVSFNYTGPVAFYDE